MAFSRRFVPMVLLWGCVAASSQPSTPTSARLAMSPVFITEVAQAATFGGTTADKVEVYCNAPAGCAPFRVCDTDSRCSGDQPALAT
jgi:hypothetical protein